MCLEVSAAKMTNVVTSAIGVFLTFLVIIGESQSFYGEEEGVTELIRCARSKVCDSVLNSLHDQQPSKDCNWSLIVDWGHWNCNRVAAFFVVSTQNTFSLKVWLWRFHQTRIYLISRKTLWAIASACKNKENDCLIGRIKFCNQMNYRPLGVEFTGTKPKPRPRTWCHYVRTLVLCRLCWLGVSFQWNGGVSSV